MASSLVTSPAPHNLTRNPIFVTLESDHMTGGSAPYSSDVDNLSAHVEVWRDTDSGEEKLGTLRGPYSSTDKRVSFDIASLLRKGSNALPTAAAVGIATGDPYYAEAEGIVDVFRIKSADQYGDPVAVDTLDVSDDYIAINGGLPADKVQAVNLAMPLIALHSYYYKRADAYTFRKPVSMDQPDFLYIVALVTGDIDVVVTRNYSDGTTDYYTAVTMSVTINKAYWVQAGFNQLKVPIDAAPGKTIIGYQVSFIYDDQDAYTAFFVLDNECPAWERYILYHNGFGGYETVRMKGITKYTHRVSRETFQHTKWIDFNIQEGEIDQIRTLGGAVFNTHTGHYPPWYCEHLRQLLHGKLWLIDLELSDFDTYRFKRIMCETDTVEPRQEDAGPHGFSITYSHAWLDDGFNVY